MINITPALKIFSDPEIKSKFFELKQDENFFYLYKHYTIDKNKEVLDMFEKSTLRFRRSNTFNDPYDCYFIPECSPDLSDSELHKNYYEQSIKAGNSYFYEDHTNPDSCKLDPNCSEVIKAHIENDLKLLKNPVHLVEKIRQSVFFTSFNNSPGNLLLWSHYANEYYGFMVIYKFPKSLDDGLIPLPVSYSDKIPKVEFNLYAFRNMWLHDEAINFLKNSFLVKAKDWQYENEFRLFANGLFPSLGLEDTFYLKIPPEYFDSVVLGERLCTNAETTNLILSKVQNANRVNGTNIQVYQSRINSLEYKIDFKHPLIDM